MLNEYIAQTQRYLHDTNATYYSQSDLTSYINTARGQIALEGECVRFLATGRVIGGTVTSGGSGYTSAPTVGVSGVGTGAIATATISAGAVNAIIIDILDQGTGYDGTTTFTFTGGGGTGAAATPVQTLNLTTAGREIYPFTKVASNSVLPDGVLSILGVISISMSWGSMRPMLGQKIWSEFQAAYRSYSQGLQNYSTIWSQYGQGEKGSAFLWPIPSQASAMDWDCFCRPIPLADDTTVEAIPFPWTDAVQYYAAYLAFNNSQRQADADRALRDYERWMKRSRAMSEVPVVPNYYDQDA